LATLAVRWVAKPHRTLGPQPLPKRQLAQQRPRSPSHLHTAMGSGQDAQLHQ